jgi:hypothetical protein
MHRDLVGKPEGKSPLRRRTYKWYDNIKMAAKETGWDDVWLWKKRRDVVNVVMNFGFYKMQGIFLT